MKSPNSRAPSGASAAAVAVPEEPALVLPEEALRRSLRAADRDAAASATMNGLTDPFMIPYALSLGASAFEVGLLSSVRNLLLAVVQLFSAEGIRRLGSRRALVLWTAGLQAMIWIPLAFLHPLFGAGAVAALIGLYTIATASSALGGPAWGSLVADYTPVEQRGHYFGRRARLAGLATTLAGLLAGGILQFAHGSPLFGFATLCLLAFVARSFSWQALRQFHDAGWRDDPHLHFSFFAFLRRARRANFARFALCIAANSFGTHVAAPFFAVYLLKTGGYAYATYTVVVLAGSVAGTLASPWWGRVGDRVGNHAVLRACLAGVTVLPALWMASVSPFWMLPLNVLGAFLWAGLNLSATNFVYDAVSPARRHTCIAYFNVLNGFGVSLGAFLGSFTVARAETLTTQPLYLAFALSVVLRLASWIAFESFVREVRSVRQVGLREVVLDFVGQRLVAVLGFFSVRPEQEQGRRLRRRGRRGG